jgi:hypothetical protein
MCSLGIAMLLLFFAAGLLTLQANLSNPVKLNVYAFHAMLGAFLAYNIYWVIMLYRAFRVPSKENWGRKNINHV